MKMRFRSSAFPLSKILLVCGAAMFATFTVSSISRDWLPNGLYTAGTIFPVTFLLDPPELYEDLNGVAPARLFRENLRKDTHYVTSWANAGLTNEFLSYIHLIYLGYISNRVPIVPPFVPDDHIPRTAGALRFGFVFNVTHLRKHLPIPILEWCDVKTLPSIMTPTSEDPYFNPNVEPLGCWSTRPKSESQPINARNTEHFLGLDVSYTRVPDFTRMDPKDENDPTVKFHWLSASIMPDHSYETTGPYPLMAQSASGSRLPPDEHLACYDLLYYATSGVASLEWQFDWAPAWRRVGTHLRFSDHLADMTKGYLRKAFGIHEGKELPPMITVHIRHGDFAQQCWDGKPCLIEPYKYAQAVTAMRQKLSVDKGLNVSRVYVSSDENDPVFWKTIDEFGWKYIDHEREKTIERHGAWYPALIDKIALTFGAGFVGTDQSTFSTMSAWRVQDWNQGMAKLVTRQD